MIFGTNVTYRADLYLIALIKYWRALNEYASEVVFEPNNRRLEVPV